MVSQLTLSRGWSPSPNPRAPAAYSTVLYRAPAAAAGPASPPRERARGRRQTSRFGCAAASEVGLGSPPSTPPCMAHCPHS